MWRLERSTREYLRIGRESVERWTGMSSNIEFVASQPLPPRIGESTRAGIWGDLEAAIRFLYAAKPKVGVTLLLESALIPTFLLEIGSELWAPSHVQMLLRHRLQALYGEPGSTIDSWTCRIDYVAGERFALGFGLESSFQHALVKTCASAGIECAGLLPALAWGLSCTHSTSKWRGQPGCLAWPEQDRLILAHVKAGCVVGLNAAASLTSDSSAILRQIEIDRVRCGMPPIGPVVAVRWRKTASADIPREASVDPAVIWVDAGYAANGTTAARPLATQP